jgi:hypothetical protein
MKIKILLFSCLACTLVFSATAQVKIGDNPNTINANSLLELESTNKGLLPPRVVLTDVNSVAPLTATVPTGMMVYNSGGTVASGYYSWDGSKWVPFVTGFGGVNVVSKTANATLLKTETFVIASNNITLTLPVVTTADNGLAITVKNVGTHTHEVDVDGNGTATINGLATVSKHFLWMGKTYVAINGNWVTMASDVRVDNVFDVSATGSWTTIAQAFEFLAAHMTGPSVIRLMGGTYPISSTITINLPFPVTIQGVSYGASIITVNGLSGAMFNCETESYFKMLAFDGSGHGVAGAGDDAIHLLTDDEYYEVKDCTFDGFDKMIVAEDNVEFWVFEVDMINAVTAGIELAAGAPGGISFKISETDFIDCAIGIHLLSATNPTVSILNCGFYNPASGVGIQYVPPGFALTTATTLFATNNTWNNVGTFMSGFDFTRSDGRDANTFIKNNSGGQDQNPNCRINVKDNASATTITTSNTWYKSQWANTGSNTTKWTIADNKITYQPVNKSNGWAIITGNIKTSAINMNISIALVKNGDATNAAARFGETELRVTTASQPFQFATTVYLTDIGQNDYFEVYCTSSNTSGQTVTFLDVQWFTETK